MDGITAVTARISEIRALLHPAPAATATLTVPAPAAVRFAGTVGTASGGPSFAGALAPAVAPVGVEPLSVAAPKAKHENGRIPAAALAPIGDGGHRLAALAATAFLDLQAAARLDGVTFGVTDSYRWYDAQADVAQRKGLYSQGGLAAQPGTSQHGWGLALDLNSRAQAWMRTNAARFRFVQDTAREPRHWALKA